MTSGSGGQRQQHQHSNLSRYNPPQRTRGSVGRVGQAGLVVGHILRADDRRDAVCAEES